jgi:hypothetical protein
VAGAVWMADEPPDHGAAITVMGLLGLVVIYVGATIERLTTNRKGEARGFPIEPKRPDHQG